MPRLPPGTDGQSYHPYGTGTRSLPRQEYHKDHPELNLEGFTPTIDIRMPEGWAHTFLQTESLMRHLNPDARLKQRPPGVERFYHYITEHGVVPAECGVDDARKGWNLKTLCLTRSLCLWLNKGVDVMHYFAAYDADPLGMGLLPVDLPKLPSESNFDRVATVPLAVLRNLTRALADSVPLEKLRPLSVEITPLGKDKMVFAGDARHPPLWHRDVVAVLPFQSQAGQVRHFRLRDDLRRDQAHRHGGLPAGDQRRPRREDDRDPLRSAGRHESPFAGRRERSNVSRTRRAAGRSPPTLDAFGVGPKVGRGRPVFREKRSLLPHAEQVFFAAEQEAAGHRHGRGDSVRSGPWSVGWNTHRPLLF